MSDVQPLPASVLINNTKICRNYSDWQMRRVIMSKKNDLFGIKMLLSATFQSASRLFVFLLSSILVSWISQRLLLGQSILNHPLPTASSETTQSALRYANPIPQMIAPWSQHWSSVTSEKHRPSSQKDWWWWVCECVCVGVMPLLWISVCVCLCVFFRRRTAVIYLRAMRHWTGTKGR